jgi:ADP-dependent NAD(P)H-hydrate dehydratase / NAD(P)H-hydrate epimerase
MAKCHFVVTPAEMRGIDASADVPVEVLIERAGWAVARVALTMLGGAYGRNVLVIAGPGNNGADGLVAARFLERRGVKVRVVRVDRESTLGRIYTRFDLVIDAAFGTGFHGVFVAPDVQQTPVLAVDIPSGVDGLTGLVSNESMPFICARTVTFAALKPGLLFGEGPRFAGEIEVTDIGLIASSSVFLLDEEYARSKLPSRSRTAHKWKSAVAVVGGSNGMTGAASLAARAAMRTGAGMVQLGIPGDPHPSAGPFGAEVVGVSLPATEWAATAKEMSQRCSVIIVGPGLARTADTVASVRSMIERLPDLPMVIDADGLRALRDYVVVDRKDSARIVLTPHDGEFESVMGVPVGEDRIAAARAMSASTKCDVLLKGPTTVVASLDGRVALVNVGDERLATAGSGDVLSGIIGALISMKMSTFDAASVGAYIHGAASNLGWRRGLIASDVVDLIPKWMNGNAGHM